MLQLFEEIVGLLVTEISLFCAAAQILIKTKAKKARNIL
jgi:hypothetical protein